MSSIVNHRAGAGSRSMQPSSMHDAIEASSEPIYFSAQEPYDSRALENCCWALLEVEREKVTKIQNHDSSAARKNSPELRREKVTKTQNHGSSGTRKIARALRGSGMTKI